MALKLGCIYCGTYNTAGTSCKCGGFESHTEVDAINFLKRISEAKSRDIALITVENVRLQQEVIDLQAVIDAADSQEPAAYLYKGEPRFDGKHWSRQLRATTKYQLAKFKSDGSEPTPLYTSPMPERQSCNQALRLLAASRENFEKHFGVSDVADWVYQDLAELLVSDFPDQLSPEVPSPRITEQDALLLQTEFKEIMNDISVVNFDFIDGEPVTAPRSGKSTPLVIGIAWKVFKATKLNNNPTKYR